MALLTPSGVSVVKQGHFEGASFGQSSYTVYEVCSPELEGETPCLIVWLHGQDMGHIPTRDLLHIQRRLGRRTFWLVPRNPEIAGKWVRFLWALGYTKAQNKHGLGFVNGQLDTPFLDSLCAIVKEVAQDVRASHVAVCGYSMGGFGAVQLAGHAPQLFDAVVAIAGHCCGTLEPQDRGYKAPQPHSSEIFARFLQSHAPNLAQIPLVVAVHARRDSVCNFGDMEGLVEAVQTHGGRAELVVVPDDMADSDLGRRSKVRSGHSYYYYSLINDTSEGVLFERLRSVLCTGSAQQNIEGVVLQPPAKRQCLAPPAQSSSLPQTMEEALSQVKERLQRSRSQQGEGGGLRAKVRALVEACGLGDAVELALEMLGPDHLTEILAGEEDIRRKLAGSADADVRMLWLISQLDEEAATLAQRLRELEGEQDE